MAHLTNEVRRLKDALSRLRRVFDADADRNSEAMRVASHERLGEVLKILRQMLEKYPSLQSDELVGSASNLIQQVKNFDYEAEHCSDIDPKDFHDALDSLAQAFSNRVSQYVESQGGSGGPGSAASKLIGAESLTNKRSLTGMSMGFGGPDDLDDDTIEGPEDTGDLDDEEDGTHKDLTVDQIDAILVRHDKGVDLALDRAKIWSKYAKDVMNYVDKRVNLELDLARNLTKLAQSCRPVLNEESFLPFQSIYCMALDQASVKKLRNISHRSKHCFYCYFQDLEMCASTQATCSLLQGYKFMDPLAARRKEHEKTRTTLKERWNTERRRLKDAVMSLKKTESLYHQRQVEYEKSKETTRIAEQNAELGANADNKVEKHRRREDEALQKRDECEAQYRISVVETNELHRHILTVKTDILRQVRELIIQCDQTMKAVTVNYFQLLHTDKSVIPTQYQTLCESSRLYEPGTQFMEYVRRLPPVPMATMPSDPFSFKPFLEHEQGGGVGYAEPKHSSSSRMREGKRSTFSLESSSSGSVLGDDLYPGGSGGSGGVRGMRRDMAGPMVAWTPSMGTIDPSDTESIESGKSSPTATSPLVTGKTTTDAKQDQAVIFDHHHHDSAAGSHHVTTRGVVSSTSPLAMHSSASGASGGASSAANELKSSAIPTSPTTPPRRQFTSMSRAAKTHRFHKSKIPARCRECDKYIVSGGFDCSDCGLSTHKKCIETLALMCGHQRMRRKMNTFGVPLTQHLLETGAQVPPLVIKCAQEIDNRGLQVTGIYRQSGANRKMEKLCQAFENGAELVDLQDIGPHNIASVLKLYLRQLPELLLTSSLYDDIIRIAKQYPAPIENHHQQSLSTNSNNSNEAANSQAPLASAESSSPPTSATTAGGSVRGGGDPVSRKSSCPSDDDGNRAMIQQLRELCHRLPKAHYDTLAYIVHHLARVAAESETNKMSPSNLGTCFAPTLLRVNSENPDMDSIADTKYHARVIELFITHATQVFGPPESVVPKEMPTRRGATIKGKSGKSSNGKSGRGLSRDSDLISSQTERRGEVPYDEFPIPGLVSSTEQGGGSNEDIFGASVSDDEDDDPIPDFLLLDHSSKSKKSPLSYRDKSTPPKIIKQSLKNFSGLEGVTPGMLSTQDSLEVCQKAVTSATTSTTAVTTATARRSVHQEMSMPTVHMPSEITVFKQMGRAAKKHSLEGEESFFSGNTPDGTGGAAYGDGGGDAVDGAVARLAAGEPLVSSSSAPPTAKATSPGRVTGFRSSHSFGITGVTTTSTNSVRSGSLSEETSAGGRKRQSPVAQTTSLVSSRSSSGMASTEAGSQPLSQSMPAAATILNLEENRVTIQVPGVQNAAASVVHRNQHHSPVVKQTSIDKGKMKSLCT